MALPLWAERNDALKLTLSLSLCEHLVNRNIIFLKEFEHGDLSRIASRVMNRLSRNRVIAHLEARVVVHDDARLDDFLLFNMNILELVNFFLQRVQDSASIVEFLDSHLGSGESASLSSADVVDVGKILASIILFNQQLVLMHFFSRKGHGNTDGKGETFWNSNDNNGD